MLAKCCASGRQRRVLHDDRTRPLRALRHYGGKHARRARVPRPVRARMHQALSPPQACTPTRVRTPTQRNRWPPRPHLCARVRLRCARAPMRLRVRLGRCALAASSTPLCPQRRARRSVRHSGHRRLRSGTLSVRSAPLLVAIRHFRRDGFSSAAIVARPRACGNSRPNSAHLVEEVRAVVRLVGADQCQRVRPV